MGTIWEQMLYLRHNKIIQPMKATAFIRKTASKNDTNSVATIYFRLRDGKKDIKGSQRADYKPKPLEQRKARLQRQGCTCERRKEAGFEQ